MICPTARKTILYIYAVHQGLLFGAVYLSHSLSAVTRSNQTGFAVVTENLSHWDGRWYLRIAENGYNAKSAAFFPFYPAVIRLLKEFTIEPVVGGLLVSNLAFLAVCIFFYKLVRLDYDRQVSARALWYLALFPTAFYFSTLYAESVFLAFVLFAFYAARTGRWWIAGFCGMLAGLTRNLGVFLLAPLLYEYLARNDFKLRAVRPDLAWLGLIPVGPVIFMVYLWQVLGNPLAFLTAQKFWHRSFAFPWEAVYRACLNILTDYNPGRNLLDLLFTVLAGLLIGLAGRKIRFSYLLYLLIGLLIPLCSTAPQAGLYSMPRFVLVLFPIYLILAGRVRSAWFHGLTLALFTGSLVCLSIIFSYSGWVA